MKGLRRRGGGQRPRLASGSARRTASTRHARLAPLLAGALVLTVACSPREVAAPLGGGPGGDPSPRQQIELLLAARAARLQSGDAEGYLRPVAPPARPLEEAIARGAAQVPLARIEQHLDREADVPPGPLPMAAAVTLAYAYEGLPQDNLFRIELVYGFEPGQDAPVIARSEPAPEPRLPPWVTGRVEQVRSRELLTLHRPGAQPAQALALLHEARERLIPRLPSLLDGAQLVFLARNRREYEEMTPRGPAPPWSVAQADASYEISSTLVRARGRVLSIDAERLASSSEGGDLLRHELALLALTGETRPFTPAWLAQAAAMYLAERRPVRVWRRGVAERRFESISLERLAAPASMQDPGASGEATSYVYAYAAAAAWYLVESFGPARFWQLYRTYGEIPAQEVQATLRATARAGGADGWGDLSARTTARGLQTVYGLDLARLDAAVRDWIRRAAA